MSVRLNPFYEKYHCAFIVTRVALGKRISIFKNIKPGRTHLYYGVSFFPTWIFENIIELWRSVSELRASLESWSERMKNAELKYSVFEPTSLHFVMVSDETGEEIEHFKHLNVIGWQTAVDIPAENSCVNSITAQLESRVSTVILARLKIQNSAYTAGADRDKTHTHAHAHISEYSY